MTDQPRHEYLGGSAGCWKSYGDILAKEYGDFRYMKYHRWTVDAYAAQHPGVPDPRAIQSVHVHLLALYLLIERKAEPRFISRVMGQAAQTQKGKLSWLTPPSDLGKITVVDILGADSPEEHGKRAEAWGRCVWEAWREHHAAARGLALELIGG